MQDRALLRVRLLEMRTLRVQIEGETKKGALTNGVEDWVGEARSWV